MGTTSVFRLFRAPIEESSEYAGDGTCSICEEECEVLFELGIGADIVEACGACGAANALDADDAADGACGSCGAVVPFPIEGDDAIAGCADCLRNGRFALTKDTELGMVRWEDAREGMTHGRPGLDSKEWELTPPDAEGWVRAKVPAPLLEELVRTPGYPSIQGDNWLFCCREPMAYIGAWSRERFDEEAPDGDGRTLFTKIVENITPGLWEDELHDETGIYVFECVKCARRRAHWDVA